MNKTKIIAVFLIAVTFASCSFHIRPKFTFVQKSSSAIFDGKILTLFDVQNQTIFYSKYPNQYQLAGHVENQKFIDSWNAQNKGDDNIFVNAFLSYYDDAKNPFIARIHLHEITKEENMILYKINIMNDKILHGEKLHNVTLFVQ